MKVCEMDNAHLYLGVENSSGPSSLPEGWQTTRSSQYLAFVSLKEITDGRPEGRDYPAYAVPDYAVPEPKPRPEPTYGVPRPATRKKDDE